MGLFDFFKKKAVAKPNVVNAVSAAPMQPVSIDLSKKKATSKENGQKHRLAGVEYYEESIMRLAVENGDYSLTKDKIIKSGLTDKTIFKFLFPSEPVILEFEPDNKHDPNAIKVLLSGQHIGYIKAGSCSRVRNLIVNDKIDSITCSLTGGPYKAVFNENPDPDDKPEYHMERGTASFGANIRIFEKL